MGEPGVGKTAIAEGLARKIQMDEVPEALKGAPVYALDMGAVLAGTKYRGEFEQRFKASSRDQKKSRGILSIDEIHTIVGAGAGPAALGRFKHHQARARRPTALIGSTTYSEYKAAFERDRTQGWTPLPEVEVGEPGRRDDRDFDRPEDY